MTSTCQAYNPQLCNVPHHGSGGVLPFTGSPALTLVLVAWSLIAIALILRGSLLLWDSK